MLIMCMHNYYTRDRLGIEQKSEMKAQTNNGPVTFL
jgi:hypothetical protein